MSGFSKLVGPRQDGAGRFSVEAAAGGAVPGVAPIVTPNGVRSVDPSDAHVGGSVAHRGSGGEGGLDPDPDAEDPDPDEDTDEDGALKKPRRRRKGGGAGAAGPSDGGVSFPAAPTGDAQSAEEEVCDDFEDGIGNWDINTHDSTTDDWSTTQSFSPTHSLHFHMVRKEIESGGGVITTTEGNARFSRTGGAQPGGPVRLHFRYWSDDILTDSCEADLESDSSFWSVFVPGAYDVANIGVITTFHVDDGTLDGYDTGLTALASAWNDVILIGDPDTSKYVSLTVNGVTVDLSAVSGFAFGTGDGTVFSQFTLGLTRAGHAGTTLNWSWHYYFDDICMSAVPA